MSGELLIPQDVSNLPAIDDKEFASMVSSTSFLPRIQLFGSNSAAVKEDKISQGHFGLVRNKDTIINLTKEVDCLPVSYHFKAMRIADGEVETVLDHKSELFQEIKELSAEQDSGCMYGVEFLLWIPQGEGEYCTFFLNSVSSRRIAPDLRALVGKAATLKSHLVKTTKYSWFAPKVVACSTPFPFLPDQAEIPEIVNKFNTVPKGDETVKGGGEERAR